MTHSGQMGALIGRQGGEDAALAHVTTRLAAAVVHQFKLIRASWNLRILVAGSGLRLQSHVLHPVPGAIM